MSSNVTLVNKTSSTVTFGLWSAPNNHSVTKKVGGKGSADITLDHNDARIIGAWIDSDDLYATNDDPKTRGYYFKDDQNYTVILDPATGISVVPN